ncbi:MAG: response regulator [Bdellovibrionota bacterium]
MKRQVIKITLIDEDEDDFILATDQLKNHHDPNCDYELKWCSNFQEGLAALKAQASDIYILDHMIDCRGGCEIFNELKKTHLKQPIIFLTNNNDDDSRSDFCAARKESDGLLSKRYLSESILEQAVQFYVRNAHN